MDRRLAPLFTWRSCIADSDLAPVTRHVALALSLYMNERGGSAFPGAPLLAHDTGLHVSTVREKLTELVDGGWLELIHRGGRLSDPRRANEYRAKLPLAVGDGCETDTPRPARGVQTAHPSPPPRLPLAVGDPISSLNSSIPGADAPTTGVRELVEGYVEDYRVVCNGHDPPRDWRNLAARHVLKALADGETPEAVAACLGVCAREGKSPQNLRHVLADMHAGRERRQR